MVGGNISACSLALARTRFFVALRDPKLRDPLSDVVSVIIALNAGARCLRSLLNYRLRSANNVPLSNLPLPLPSVSRPRTHTPPSCASILFHRARRDRAGFDLLLSFSLFRLFPLPPFPAPLSRRHDAPRRTFFSLHPWTESASYLMGHGLNYDCAPLSLVSFLRLSVVSLSLS